MNEPPAELSSLDVKSNYLRAVQRAREIYVEHSTPVFEAALHNAAKNDDVRVIH